MDLLRFVTCGSVDDGKSTLIGRLFFESKQIFGDQMSALEKDSARFGAQGSGIGPALLVDARKGLLTRTRRHSRIVSMLGVRLACLCNGSTGRTWISGDIADASRQARWKPGARG